MRQRVALIALVSGACLSAAARGQTPAFGPEGLVNTYTTNNQQQPRCAADSNGDFVVTWESYGQDGDGYGAFGQFLPGFGLVPPEFQASGFTTGNQYQTDVAMDASGNFVVVWNSPYLFNASMYGQLFDNTGTPVGSQFGVDYGVLRADGFPRVSRAALGSFVVVWGRSYDDGSGYGIFGQRFDSFATPVGGRFQVNTYTTGYQARPAVASGALGNFVVAWQSYGQDGDRYGIFGQRYDAAGNPLGGEFQVNTYTPYNQFHPAVALDGSGNFVVVWQSFLQDGSGYGIFGQRFDNSGNRVGGEFRVNAATANDQLAPAVAADGAGGFLVVWTSFALDASGGISGQLFNAAGAPAGAEFPINAFTTGLQSSPSVAFASNGTYDVSWQSDAQDGSQNGVVSRAVAWDVAHPMAVDAHAATGTVSNLNGVLEAGETVQVEPAWKNFATISLLFSGTASIFTGPPGPTYTLDDTSAGYGTIAPGATANCYDATVTHNCYVASVSGSRPAPHWDATFLETLAFGVTKTWTLHVGESFPDEPTSDTFYAYVENLFHNGITGGCGGGNYCPTFSVTRAQMAVFLLKAKHGATHVPPACAGIFGDVTCPSQFADWIEELAAEGITGGCGGGNYCPNNPVTRAQMAAFLLKSEHGSLYAPPACAGIFGDVSCPSQFADWIEQLAAEGITGGCGSGNYCPNNPNTRGQMAVFLVKTFGLQLYGP